MAQDERSAHRTARAAETDPPTDAKANCKSHGECNGDRKRNGKGKGKGKGKGNGSGAEDMPRKWGLSLDASTLTIARGLAFALSLIIPMVFVRVFTTHQYATFRQLTLLFSTLQTIFILGIPLSLQYFYPRAEGRDKDRFVTQTMFVTLIIGGVFFATLIAAGPFLTTVLFHRNLGGYMLLLAFHAFFSVCTSFLAILMTLHKDVKLCAVTTIAFSALDLLLLPGSALLTRTVSGLFIGIVIGSGIKMAVAYFYIFRNFRVNFSGITTRRLRRQLVYVIPLGVSSILSILNVNIDKFFVSYFLTAEIFAIYSIGSFYTPYISILTSSVRDVLVPNLSKLGKLERTPEFIALWHEAIRKVALIFFTFSFFVALIATEMITLLFTDTYFAAVPVFMVYLLIILVRGSLFNNVLVALGETKTILKVTAFSVGANFIMNFAFIVAFLRIGFPGYIAPPLATVIVAYITSAITIVMIARRLGITIRRTYPWRTIAWMTAVSTASFLITFMITTALGTGLLSTLYPPLDALAWSPLATAPKIIRLVLTAAIFLPVHYLLLRNSDMLTRDDLGAFFSFVRPIIAKMRSRR